MLSYLQWAAARDAAPAQEPAKIRKTPTMLFVEQLKEHLEVQTDGELARHLGEFRMTVRRWSNGDAAMPDTTGRTVARMLGLPTRDVLDALSHEREERRLRRRSRDKVDLTDAAAGLCPLATQQQDG